MTASSFGTTTDPEFRAELSKFGIQRIEHGSLLSISSPALIRGWTIALDRANRRLDVFTQETQAWVQKVLQALASQPAGDDIRARAAEAEAALRLSWIGQVERVRENSNASVDFRMDDVNLEVYCPQKHTDERRVVEADLAEQLERANGPVRVAISINHPTTGSGRRVDSNGRIQRDPTNVALKYPANKLMDRLLSNKKREGRQFPDSETNVLWLDLRHGLGMHAMDCVPFRSRVEKGTCFVGPPGVWHAFYGECGSPHFRERTTLEWSIPQDTYEQQRIGWFREMPKVSAAVLSVLDGILLFENPWADIPLDARTRGRFARLSEFRPELSWIGASDGLKSDVESALEKISWLAQITRAPTEEAQA